MDDKIMLIVDDNEINQGLLTSIFEDDFTIKTADDGRAALAVLERYGAKVSIVLLDLVMPDMDGFAVLAEMREKPELRAIPVVVVSGQTDREASLKAVRCGAADFVTKPVDPDWIGIKVQAAISRAEDSEKLRYQAERDALTGLYNRDAFFKKASEMIRAREPGHYIMACFDIDNFKVINDQYGTAKGDEVLIFIADTFRTGFSPVGGIVGRIMADNFAVLYPASLVGSPLLSEIRGAASTLDGSIHPISFSIGRYLADDLSLSASAMYDRAAIAEASIKGRYDVRIAQYDESMRESLIREQKIVNEMTYALESEQFEVWLQPQYNHATKALIGAEALVRWRHPEKGIIPPGEFIPVFERNGFVYELDSYVWERSCALLRSWLDDAREPLPVSVNISRHDLFHDDLVDVVTGLVDKYGIPRDLLRLEITESAFAESAEQVVRVVKSLIERGFTVEIDDFGSGYSSLNTLKDVPAHVLKLDMRFLESGEDADRGGNVLESIVRMAKWLGMAVIAEGVETIEQADYLKSIGCVYIQGYLYAKPMPLHEYEALASKTPIEGKLLALETVKNLDNNAFWNPESMDTLIFNSFVGAACIVEFRDGNVELVRVSDMFMKMLESESMTAEDAMKLDWRSYYSERNKCGFAAAVRRSIETGENVTGEYSFDNLPGCAQRVYLRITLRVIASAGSSHLVYCLSENITAQKELEEKERANAAQLQAIMDNINGGVAVAVIRDGLPQIQFANEQYYEQRGYTKEQYETELVNSSLIVHEDDREKTLGIVVAVDEPVTVVYRIVRRDGAVRWLQNNISMVKLPGIEGLAQLSVSNDITELRDAERREREVSERLQTILGALNCGVSGVTMTDGRLRYLFANDMYYSMLGYTREQFEAEVKSGFDPVHPDDTKRIRGEIERLFETRGSKILEYRAIRRDGETVYLRVNVSVVALDGIDGLVNLGVAADITDLVQARQQVTELTERMQTILDNVDCGITAAIVDGEEITYLFGNDRFYELHGYTKQRYRDEVEDIFDLAHPDDRRMIVETVAAMDEIGKKTMIKYRVIHPDGVERWLRTTIAVHSLADVERPVQFTVYADITEERLSHDKERAAKRSLELLNTRIENEHLTLQTMMDDMPGGFARLRVLRDGGLETVYVNDSFCLMSGFSRQESLYGELRQAMSLVHPDDIELVRETLADMVATREKRRIEFRLRQAGGGYVPLSAFARVTTGEDSDDYLNVYCAELSERDKKEMTIRETAPLVLSAILASSTNLAFAKDLDFRYICASADFLRITDYTRESDVIGKTDYDLFPKEHADRFRREDMSLLETDAPLLDYVDAVPMPDGGIRYYKLSKYVLRDTLGNTLGVYGIGRDITEEKDAYARLKLLVDSIPGGIAAYIASPDGVKMTYFNDGWCGMLGYTREEYESVAAAGIASQAFSEDAPGIIEKAHDLIREDKPLDSTHRVHTKNGGYKWVNMRGSVAERHDDICVINAVLFDITERVEAENVLRMSEERFRIASAIDGKIVTQYDIKTGEYHHQNDYLLNKGFDRCVKNVPQAFIDAGIIAPEYVPSYLEFYDKLRKGESPCSVDIAVEDTDGAWRWLREDATVLRDADAEPSKAIIVFTDITELREKETVFRKWRQSLRQRPAEAYKLYRSNLSKNSSFDSEEGELLWVRFSSASATFNDRTNEYAVQCVYEGDRAEYISLINSDTLLADYYRGIHTRTLDYREAMPDGTLRWLRVTAELVEYPNSTDVEAFLLYENIDADKRAEIRAKELAEIDPLTGALNRAAFAQAVGRVVRERTNKQSHAILMLDIDSFKRINDTLGHMMGDSVLKDTADTLRGVLRRGDLLGRLGGDEFLICLRDIYNDEAVKKKAEQICSLLNKTLGIDVQTSMSIGIAVAPRDGEDFETLYRKADTALYKVKESGKNNYAFFDESMKIKPRSVKEAADGDN